MIYIIFQFLWDVELHKETEVEYKPTSGKVAELLNKPFRNYLREDCIVTKHGHKEQYENNSTPEIVGENSTFGS